jgi:hypothetical protein
LPGAFLEIYDEVLCRLCEMVGDPKDILLNFDNRGEWKVVNEDQLRKLRMSFLGTLGMSKPPTTFRDEELRSAVEQIIRPWFYQRVKK